MRRFLGFFFGVGIGTFGLVAVGILAAAVLAPAPASADYLYGLNKETGAEPYVLFVADVSGSMDFPDAGCPDGYVPRLRTEERIHPRLGKIQIRRCRRTVSGTIHYVDQYTRMEALQATLRSLIPRMDNIVLGMSTFGVSSSSSNMCKVVLNNPLPTSSRSSPPSQNQLLSTVELMKPDGGTPLGQALADALTHLKLVRAADVAGSCRPYAVVVLTDGAPDCSSRYGGTEDSSGYGNKARGAVDDLKKAGIRTFAVGFGADADRDLMNDLARRGETARRGGAWCGSCEGEALHAEDAGELLDVLGAAFGEIKRGQYTVMPPMVATVPQVKTEYDRVSNNFLAYSAFEMPDNKGRLYGIRLFEEDEDEASVWRFTDLSDDNEDFSLSTCGAAGNPCVFEAGALLQRRTKPRNIYFSYPASTDTTDGGVVMKMAAREALPRTTVERQAGAVQMFSRIVDEASPLALGVTALSAGDRGILEALANPTNLIDGTRWRTQVAEWIDGTARPWRLGDIYHSAPGIVTYPPYSYRGYGYPVFKANYRQRPSMIYVGANDGQIHAFHASDDHFPPDGPGGEEGTPRWHAGEEAWSYVPFNMLAKVALSAVKGEKRVFSQDLSCRVDDAIAYPTIGGTGEVDCSLDPEHEDRGTCGWRTVMVCGQGWGGSWYVALDVTDPLDPRPMWEATNLGDREHGLGRTWVVPSVGAVNMEKEIDGKKVGVPTWLAIYGSGYNTLLKDHNGQRSHAYRYLNMSFAGAYPEHGAGIQGEKGNPKDPTSFVFVQDLVSGKFLKRFAMAKQYGVTADIPLVGTRDRFFINVGYVGGWQGGTLGRVAFPTTGGMTKPDDWTYCSQVLAFSESKPLTSRPSVFSSPRDPTEIYAFVGSGLDPGNDPDQQANQGKMWEFQAFRFSDDGTGACPTVKNANICTSGEVLKNMFNDGSRLIAPPTLAVQQDMRKWLTFTTWKPSSGTQVCGSGTSYLYCLDVSDGARCHPCGKLNQEASEDNVKVELGGHKSQTPVVADGQIYVIGDDGVPLRIANQDGGGSGPGGGAGIGTPNQGAPRAMVLSWREIF